MRVIAASNKGLWDLVAKGGFREDLFYRVNVITIDLPPLRDRGADLDVLIDHFLELINLDSLGRPEGQSRVLGVGARKALHAHRWPGNVRELENVIHRLVVMTDGDCIDVPDLPASLRFSVAREQDLTREPEMVRAYRDTWTLGVHSYLAYLRDRLTVARELLTESGSGTLAGNAHSETLVGLARADAAAISEVFQRQFDREILKTFFPGETICVYFKFDIPRAQETMAQLIEATSALSWAGYRINQQQLEEKLGLKIEK